MAYSRQFTCDVCGIHKKLLNKWFLVDVTDTCVCIRVFDNESAKQKRFAILCGQNCLQKYLSQKLDLLLSQPQSPVALETARVSKSVEAPGEK
ncbi:MAG: hypothetical protein ABSC77_03010 [Terracidiphilus sp.]|jgi:hypothetical protein